MAMRSFHVAGRATKSLEFQTPQGAAPFRRFFGWKLSLVTATLLFHAVALGQAPENPSGSASADPPQSISPQEWGSWF